MAGEQHEFKTVVDLVDAIFNGYAGHGLPLSCDGFDGKLARSITRARPKYKLYGSAGGFAAFARLIAGSCHDTSHVVAITIACNAGPCPWISINCALSRM
ncbi:hypothetical protein ACVOMV_29955 [Mesorhizobium atlanticum]